MDDDFEVRFEGRIDIGLSNDPRMKMMPPVYNENELTTYVGVMIKSKIYMIELIARIIDRNNVDDRSSRSLILPESDDEQSQPQ
jgi:hypothetical protein